MVASCCCVMLSLVMLASSGDALSDSLFTKLESTKRLLNSLARRGILGGNMIVNYNGQNVFKQAFGKASPELGVPLKTKHLLPVGSNGKLFTAVALWQLHERGLINMHATVNQYMDKTDFNQTTDWCPRLHSNASDTTCYWPTAAQLLFMGSGLIDVDNCRYPEGAWQRAYCRNDDAITNEIDNSPTQGVIGGHTPAEYFSAIGYWNFPMEAKPGLEYQYVNINYVLATYLVEKLSGMRYGAYLRKYIFTPAQLTSSMYEITNGNNGAAPNWVLQAGQRAIFSPVSQGYISNITNTSSRDPSALKKVPPGRFVEIARVYDVPGFLAWANGAGALHSTPEDMVLWWHTVLYQPQVLSLTAATVKEMLNTYNPVKTGNGYFAQGIVVNLAPTWPPYGVRTIFYQGGTPGVESPFLLMFAGGELGKGTVGESVMVGGILNLQAELQVPIVGNCMVEDVWGGGRLVTLAADLCSIFTGGSTTSYVFGQLANVWQLG